MQDDKSMYKRIGIIILIVIIAIAFVVFLLNSDDDENENISADTTQDTQSQLSTEQETQPANDVVPPMNVEEATLSSVNGYDAEGSATRSYEGGVFMHEVVATIQQPAEGKFFEGWIVGDRVVSTGRLTNESGNEWSLVFTSDEDLSTFDTIVITEETEADGLDGKPETHVLEGEF